MEHRFNEDRRLLQLQRHGELERLKLQLSTLQAFLKNADV